MFSKSRHIGTGVLLLWLVSASWAQSDHPQERNQPWDISAWVAGATGQENSHSYTQTQILSGGMFVGRPVTGEIGRGWVRGDLEFGISTVPLFVQFAPVRTYGVGFEPTVLRWNSGARRGRLAPFIEVAGGGVFSNRNLPAINTSKVNFTARAGAGVQILTQRHRAVDVGCRWSHISNANLGTQNPGFNGVQVSVAYHWFR